MNKYAELLSAAIAARKLDLPADLLDLPVDCPNIMLLTDETAALIDERDELIIAFVSSVGQEIGIQNSCGSLLSLDFTVNPCTGAIGVYYGGGWGEAGEVKFCKKQENVTLADVWKACDKLLAESGDRHHVFIEELSFDGSFISFTCGS